VNLQKKAESFDKEKSNPPVGEKNNVDSKGRRGPTGGGQISSGSPASKKSRGDALQRDKEKKRKKDYRKGGLSRGE